MNDYFDSIPPNHCTFRLQHPTRNDKNYLSPRRQTNKKTPTLPKHTILTSNGSLFKSHTHTQTYTAAWPTNLTNKSSNSVLSRVRVRSFVLDRAATQPEAKNVPSG